MSLMLDCKTLINTRYCFGHLTLGSLWPKKFDESISSDRRDWDWILKFKWVLGWTPERQVPFPNSIQVTKLVMMNLVEWLSNVQDGKVYEGNIGKCYRKYKNCILVFLEWSLIGLYCCVDHYLFSLLFVHFLALLCTV